MATVIPADRWDLDPDRLETGFQPNHGSQLTTKSILRSMDEINARPETDEFFRLIRESSQYAPGKDNEQNMEYRLA